MGTKTLLDSVNDVLESVRLISSTNALASLTDSPRQVFIDQAVKTINSTLLDLYLSTDDGLSTEVGSSSITLVATDRDYALASDLVQMRWPLRDETNGLFLYEEDYFTIVNSQAQPANYTGIPSYAAIRPTDGELYLDRVPTSAEAGRVYNYEYDKAILVSLAADTFPFSDTTWRPFMDAVKELWKRDNNLQFDPALYAQRIGNAAAFMSQKQFRKSWRRH